MGTMSERIQRGSGRDRRDLTRIRQGANGIKYFMISYTDLFGGQRAKLVPAAAIARHAEGRRRLCGLRHLARHDAGPSRPASPCPMPSSVIQLPWKPEVAWVAADCVMDDKTVDQAPRVTLKRLIAEAAERGPARQDRRRGRILPDLRRTAAPSPTQHDTAEKPCYDQQALMRRYDVIAEICDHMLALGWEPYQNDHEDANGQFEMNWEFDDALVDRRQALLLQVHGQVGRREARAARHLHAEAVQGPDRQWLPCPHLGLGQGRQDQRLRRRRRRARPVGRAATSSAAS